MSKQRIDDGGPAFPVSIQNGPRTVQFPGMTLRQYAAIKLKVPNSGTDWLDQMIRESLRDDLAAKAMQGWLATYDCTATEANVGESHVVSLGYRIADAMLKARSM